MFCTKCGKEIDYEADVCNECAAETAVAEEVVEAPAVQETVITAETVEEAIAAKEAVKEDAPEVFDAMHNFKPSLAYTIVAVIMNSIFSICSYSLYNRFIGVLMENYSAYYTAGNMLPVWIAGIPCGIVSLIFLIKSISVLKDTVAYKNRYEKTPVAPLILGIAGVVINASTLLSVVSGYFVSLLALIIN